MIIKAEEFKPAMMKKYMPLDAPSGNPHGRKEKYLNCVCAFDIETSTKEELNWMYIWQFQIDSDYTVIGRTWSEFQAFSDLLLTCIRGLTLVVYVHNLSYEFQYLKGLYQFDSNTVFATDRRKVLKCIFKERIEFRCSYFLTNMSLDAFTHKMGIEHAKIHDFDYSIVRYPWTELSEQELQYCINDVSGLVEAVKKQMQRDGDTLYTIPLTSTGYPRRDMKHSMKRYPYGRLRSMQPAYEVYELLHQAFRGGNTHANRYYAGKPVKGMVSYDRSSSYPDVIVNCPYPMGQWQYEQPDPEKVMEHIANGHAVIFTAGFYDIRLQRKTWGCPYISFDKSRCLEGGIYDNGRVLCADYLETTITDIDFRIILSEYDFEDMVIGQCYWTTYDYLPRQITSVVCNYYHDKTVLKGKEDEFSKLMYDKSKALLNGLYGMMAQNPCKQNILFDGVNFSEANDDPIELLQKAERKAFLCYQWGVWVTAWARYRLEEGIQIAESVPDSFVYCDTDSVKYVDQGQDWSQFNADRRDDSKKHKAYAVDAKGKEHYMGVFEYEQSYDRFITLGAKRYAYEDQDGLHITVSGVAKKAGAKELGSLDNFKEGFTFYHGGKTESLYVDQPDQHLVFIDGKPIEITPYVIIRDTTYYLGLTDEYRNLLELIAE